MKKTILLGALVLFLAAGCNKAADQQKNPAIGSDGSGGGQSAQQSSQLPAPNVHVSGVDDATAKISTDAGSEQSAAASGDDSDLAASDSEILNGITEVPNGN